MIRPTLILQMNLDESVYGEDVVTEIKRSYSYVAPAVVKSHETGDAAPENIMRFVVKIHRPYWLSSEEGADELWNGVMRKWLKNMVYKVSSTMVAYNRMRRQRLEPQLVFDWLEVEFGDVVIAMRLNQDCSLEEHGASDVADRVRALVNDGVLTGDIACVRIPSRASYEAQLAAVQAARAEEQAAAEADAEAAGEAEGAEDAEAKAAPAEDAAVVEGADADAPAADADVDADAGAEEAEAEREPEPEPVNFDIDTTVWGIEYADGSIKEFNSETNEFVA